MEATAPIILTLLAVVAGSFVATNLDNLLLLVTLCGSNPHNRRAVQLGFLAAVVLMLVVAAAGLALGRVLESDALGYLGIAPVLVGLHMLYQQRSIADAGTDVPGSVQPAGAQRGVWLGTFALMAGNSGDSLAVMLPLLAETGRPGRWVIVIAYLLMALAWSRLALVLADRPGVAERIEQRGARLVPWVMIAVGCYILLDTHTDTLVRL
jgi:cadmium resistance protein CadD (predicted permease)